MVVTQREVLRLSDSSNALTVRGGGNDRVFAGGSAWASQGIVNIDGTNFEQYTSGAATLNIEVGLDTTFAAVNVSTLDGTNGFRLDGVATDDFSGVSVSSAGDVNGDGFEDLIIGAEGADPNGNSVAGSSYVVFGRSGGFTSAIDLSTLDGTNGVRLDGVGAHDRAGHSVSSAGDVNGDGFDDLIIGADQANPNGNTWAGSSYVVFGKSGGFASVLNLSTLNGTTGFRLDGVAAFDNSGGSVGSAGT